MVRSTLVAAVAAAALAVPASAAAKTCHADAEGRVVARGPTSCALAINTVETWLEDPAWYRAVRAYSPVTGRYYVFDCRASDTSRYVLRCVHRRLGLRVYVILW